MKITVMYDDPLETPPTGFTTGIEAAVKFIETPLR